MNEYQYPAWNFPDMLARMPEPAQRKYKRLVGRLEDVEALLRNHMARENDREIARVHNTGDAVRDSYLDQIHDLTTAWSRKRQEGA